MAEIQETNNQKNPELIRLLQSIAKSESATAIYSSLNTSEWSAEETNFLLKVLAEFDCFSQTKSDDEQIYAKLAKIMAGNGYKKSITDIKNYWIEVKQKLSHCKSEDLIYKCSNHNDLFESDTDMVMIKGEEFENTVLESQESLHNFYDDFESKISKTNRKNNWTYKETECVVEVLEKYGMPNRSNLRRFCFIIVDYLKQNGFLRSEEQAQVKMKHLRSMYNQVIRKTVKEEDFPFFRRMKEVQMNMSNKNGENGHMECFNGIEDLKKPAEFEDVPGTDIHDEDSIAKRGRQIWTNKEVQVLLRFIEDNNIVTGKQLRKMCNKAVDYLTSYGYVRSPTQILIRWKNTKAVYWATFRKKLRHPERECIFFYQLHNILNPEDKSYENRTLEISEEELSTRNFEISNTDSVNFKEDNFTSFQNSSNSSDQLLNVQNSITSKRFPNAEVLSDPLENANSNEVIIPSSPKRSRTESTQLNLTCSSCNVLDPIDHYCISLAHSIKRLDARKQAKLKIEIQQLMYKAEFDTNF